MGKGRVAAEAIEGIAGGLMDVLLARRRERLEEAYRAKAGEMDLPARDRTQPNPFRERFLDDDYQTPAPLGERPDLSLMYPRNPLGPDAPLPKHDRGRRLVEMQPDISDALAELVRGTGQMDMPTRYFYHSDGPLYRGALKAGLSHDEAVEWLSDFGQRFAATSPRTKVEGNLLNATSDMAKEASGYAVRDIAGPGSGGISERGYPMMTGPSGIHGQLLDRVRSGEGIDLNSNTKPFMFGQNVTGNRSGVTIDTHAMRGILQTLNKMEPGSVPDGYILPKFQEAYRENPRVLTPDMLDDRPGKQKVGPKGATYDSQTEYPVFADIIAGAARRLGNDVSPAEAQSMAWFGFGDETNLGSTQQTFSDVFDERLDVTGQVLGIPTEEAARRVYRREIPLMQMAAGLGGGAALASKPGAAEASERGWGLMGSYRDTRDEDMVPILIEYLRQRGI